MNLPSYFYIFPNTDTTPVQKRDNFGSFWPLNALKKPEKDDQSHPKQARELILVHNTLKCAVVQVLSQGNKQKKALKKTP